MVVVVGAAVVNFVSEVKDLAEDSAEAEMEAGLEEDLMEEEMVGWVEDTVAEVEEDTMATEVLDRGGGGFHQKPDLSQS